MVVGGLYYVGSLVEINKLLIINKYRFDTLGLSLCFIGRFIFSDMIQHTCQKMNIK